MFAAIDGEQCVDVETGDYELYADELRALKRAKAKNPRAVLYMLRLGYPTAYRLGFVGIEALPPRRAVSVV